MLAIQFLHGLRLLLHVALVLFLDLVHFGLQLLHPGHALSSLAGDGKQATAHQHGEQNNRDAVVVHHAVEGMQDPQHPLRNAAEPTVVQQISQRVKAFRSMVLGEQLGPLRAGEHGVGMLQRGTRG